MRAQGSPRTESYGDMTKRRNGNGESGIGESGPLIPSQRQLAHATTSASIRGLMPASLEEKSLWSHSARHSERGKTRQTEYEVGRLVS